MAAKIFWFFLALMVGIVLMSAVEGQGSDRKNKGSHGQHVSNGALSHSNNNGSQNNRHKVQNHSSGGPQNNGNKVQNHLSGGLKNNGNRVQIHSSGGYNNNGNKVQDHSSGGPQNNGNKVQYPSSGGTKNIGNKVQKYSSGGPHNNGNMVQNNSSGGQKNNGNRVQNHSSGGSQNNGNNVQGHSSGGPKNNGNRVQNHSSGEPHNNSNNVQDHSSGGQKNNGNRVQNQSSDGPRNNGNKVEDKSSGGPQNNGNNVQDHSSGGPQNNGNKVQDDSSGRTQNKGNMIQGHSSGGPKNNGKRVQNYSSGGPPNKSPDTFCNNSTNQSACLNAATNCLAAMKPSHNSSAFNQTNAAFLECVSSLGLNDTLANFSTSNNGNHGRGKRESGEGSSEEHSRDGIGGGNLQEGQGRQGGQGGPFRWNRQVHGMTNYYGERNNNNNKHCIISAFSKYLEQQDATLAQSFGCCMASAVQQIIVDQAMSNTPTYIKNDATVLSTYTNGINDCQTQFTTQANCDINQLKNCTIGVCISTLAGGGLTRSTPVQGSHKKEVARKQ